MVETAVGDIHLDCDVNGHWTRLDTDVQNMSSDVNINVIDIGDRYWR